MKTCSLSSRILILIHGPQPTGCRQWQPLYLVVTTDPGSVDCLRYSFWGERIFWGSKYYVTDPSILITTGDEASMMLGCHPRLYTVPSSVCQWCIPVYTTLCATTHFHGCFFLTELAHKINYLSISLILERRTIVTVSSSGLSAVAHYMHWLGSNLTRSTPQKGVCDVHKCAYSESELEM